MARSRTWRSKAARPTTSRATPQAGMGLAIGDVNTDARLDILKTHFADDIPALYRGLGDGLFEDVATQAGLDVQNRHVEWGAGCPISTTTAGPTSCTSLVTSIPRLNAQLPQYPHRGPAHCLSQRGGQRFDDVSAASGAGRDDAAFEPWRGIRGCRQRRRRRRAHHEHERTAVAASQRLRGREWLDHDPARRREDESRTVSAPPCW